MRLAFPNADLTEPGFALQVLFVQLGTIFAGFAAASLVGGWASDESEGRMEMLLTAPVARFRWMLEAGLGTYLAIVVVALIVGIVTAIAIAATGGDVLTPLAGISVIALYGTAVAGIGLAVGGLLQAVLRRADGDRRRRRHAADRHPGADPRAARVGHEPVAGPPLRGADDRQLGSGRHRRLAGARARRPADRGLGLQPEGPAGLTGFSGGIQPWMSSSW